MSNWKRTFAFIWSGQMISALTSSITSFAIVFWLSSKSGSAEVLAYAMIATILPFSILGTFTGVYIDSLNRKKIMIYGVLLIAGDIKNLSTAKVITMLDEFDPLTHLEILRVKNKLKGSAVAFPRIKNYFSNNDYY